MKKPKTDLEDAEVEEVFPEAKIQKRRDRLAQVDLDPEVSFIFNKMVTAIEQDKRSMLNQEPSLARLIYSKQLTKDLKNLKTRSLFLSQGGCEKIAYWLSKNPDGSYPCLNVVKETLKLLSDLPITTEHLELSENIGRTVKRISQE